MKYLLAIIMSFLLSSFCFSQESQPDELNTFISLNTGLTSDNYASGGLRVQAEYLKRFKSKQTFFWGVNIDYKRRGLGSIPTYKPANLANLPPELSYEHLSFNIHHLSGIGKPGLIFDFSCGLGAIYLHNESQKSLQPAINFGFIMNIRISSKVFLEMSPIFILPPSKLTISTSRLSDERKTYTAWHLFPIGLKVKLK